MNSANPSNMSAATYPRSRSGATYSAVYCCHATSTWRGAAQRLRRALATGDRGSVPSASRSSNRSMGPTTAVYSPAYARNIARTKGLRTAAAVAVTMTWPRWATATAPECLRVNRLS